MKFFISLAFLKGVLIFTAVFACENASQLSMSYSTPESYIDCEIDSLLNVSEDCLFTGNFTEALVNVEMAESLLHLSNGTSDHRRLRSMFDKALIVTCIEGPGHSSREQFSKFETLLASKRCEGKPEKSQPNLFDQNGHWPILGENGAVSVSECLERVDNTEKSLEIACAGLNVHPFTRVAIASAIFVIAKKARFCCTEHGFWKTCIQPIVDTWKRTEIFGIPPDPYWD